MAIPAESKLAGTIGKRLDDERKRHGRNDFGNLDRSQPRDLIVSTDGRI